jgi:hypothetical protein
MEGHAVDLNYRVVEEVVAKFRNLLQAFQGLSGLSWRVLEGDYCGWID